MNKEIFLQRHSFRNFSSQDVSEELIDSILTRALKAPTTGNMQLYSIIENRDPKMLEALAPTHFNQPAVRNAKVLLTVCADFNRFTRWCELNKADAGFDNFLSFFSATADAFIVAQQIVTIAEMEGLGSCYLGTVTYNAPEISKILDLPELVVPVACIALGWPEGEPEITERLELDAVRHKEKYRHDSDSRIVDLFKVKDDYEPNAKFVKENGKDNLAQVFAEVRYPRGMNEDFSKKFIDFLKTQRFI